MLKWRGDAVVNKVMNVAQWAVDKTTSDCVREAKTNAPVKTGTYQGSIQMRPARRIGNIVVGLWGSFNVMYAIFIELGTSRMRAQHVLRRAADIFYPRLADLIRSRLRR